MAILLPAVVVVALLPASAAAPTLAVTVSARSIQPGELVVLTIRGADPAAVHVRAFDREWPAFAGAAGASRVLIGIDLAVRPGPFSIEISAGESTTFTSRCRTCAAMAAPRVSACAGCCSTSALCR